MPDSVIDITKRLSPQALEGDLVQAGHPLFGIVWINPARLSGAPCFAGTRVPVKNLFDYLADGYSLDQFLEQFPSVERSDAQAVLELASQNIFRPTPPTAA